MEGKLFYSMLITSLILIFLGLTIKIESIYSLKEYANLFVYGGILFIFLSFIYGIISAIKSSDISIQSQFLSSIDLLFLGIAMIIFTIYRDIVLSIAIFIVLYSLIRVLNKK